MEPAVLLTPPVVSPFLIFVNSQVKSIFKVFKQLAALSLAALSFLLTAAGKPQAQPQFPWIGLKNFFSTHLLISLGPVCLTMLVSAAVMGLITACEAVCIQTKVYALLTS